MIIAAERFRIQKVDTSFLARAGDQITAFEREDHRGDIHVQVAFVDPFPVCWRVPVLQFQVFRGQRDERIGIAVGGRV